MGREGGSIALHSVAWSWRFHLFFLFLLCGMLALFDFPRRGRRGWVGWLAVGILFFAPKILEYMDDVCTSSFWRKPAKRAYFCVCCFSKPAYYGY